MRINHKLAALQQKLKGELHYDNLTRHIYAKDANEYRMLYVFISIRHKSSEKIQGLAVVLNPSHQTE